MARFRDLRGTQEYKEPPIFILGCIPRRASRALPVPVLLFPLDAKLFERGLEAFSEGQPRWAAPRVSGGIPGSEIGKLCSGTGWRRWKGDSKAVVIWVDVVELIWGRPA